MKELFARASCSTAHHVYFKKLIALVILATLSLSALTSTVSAKNTYIITDGDTVVVHSTFLTDPADVLQEAGVTISEDDTIVTQQSDGISEIVVSRYNSVTLNNRGKIHQISTTADTVGALLESCGAALGENVTVSPALTVSIADGMIITVTETTTTYEKELSPIASEEMLCAVSWLDSGERLQAQSGTDGEQSTTFCTTYENGVAVRREVVSSAVVTAPIRALTYVGIADNADARFTEQNGVLVSANGDTLAYSQKLGCIATAYSCEGYYWNTTATGTTARTGCIAVDPKVIPLGSKVYIETDTGDYIYGTAIAEDTGGAIKGNRVDLYMDTVSECFTFGRRACNVYILS
ncbi:MAG: 3D domain-containing protein [Oscillospiraceae bacterium]|nr:3D domain-containing protein [Oscillospiraceae bacterium]